MSSLDPRDLERRIRQTIAVDVQLALLAKAFLLQRLSHDGPTIGDQFAAHIDAALAAPVLIHASVSADDVVTRVARYLSAKLAVAEATWALIGAGVLVPRSEQLCTPVLRIGWTTVIPGAGGAGGGWDFGDLALPLPRVYSHALSLSSRPYILTDGDLYLRGIDAPLHPVVEEALRDAVRCFRADLYLPAVTMLGKATEGVWMLLAAALVAVGGDDRAAVRLGRDLDRLRFAQLVDSATELYARQDLFGGVADASGITLDHVRHIRLWSHEIRDSRNVVHFNASTPLPNTYEKVAALLLGAVPNLGDLVRLTEVATVAGAPNGAETRSTTGGRGAVTE